MRVKSSYSVMAMSLFALSGLSVAPAYAVGIVAQTGFNDASGINANLDPNSPYLLGAAIVGNGAVETGWGGAWTAISGGTTAARGSVTTATVFEGDGALRQAAGQGTNSANISNFRRLFAAPLTGVFTVDYRIRIEAMFAAQDWSLQVGDSAGGSSIAAAAMIRIVHDTVDGGHQNLHYYAGDGVGGVTSTDTGVDLALDTWYKLTSKVDTEAKKWSLLLNDVEIASNIGFRWDSAAGNMDVVVSWLNRGNSGTSTTDVQITYLDAVVITQVPEPGSIIMIGIGITTLFAFRLRRKV